MPFLRYGRDDRSFGGRYEDRKDDRFGPKREDRTYSLQRGKFYLFNILHYFHYNLFHLATLINLFLKSR